MPLHQPQVRCLDVLLMIRPLTRTHSWVNVALSLDHERDCVNIRAEAHSTGGTGVEMEAMTGADERQGHHRASNSLLTSPAAAVAGLTVYDMVKAVARGARLVEIQLEHKSGGKSGEWTRPLSS